MTEASSISPAAPKKPDAEAFAIFALSLWIVAAMTFLFVVVAFAAPFAPVFAALDVELPLVTRSLVALGSDVSTPLGYGVALMVVAATVVPFMLGARGRKAAKRYFWAALAMFFFASIAFFAVHVPLNTLQQKLSEEPGSHALPK